MEHEARNHNLSPNVSPAVSEPTLSASIENGKVKLTVHLDSNREVEVFYSNQYGRPTQLQSGDTVEAPVDNCADARIRWDFRGESVHKIKVTYTDSNVAAQQVSNTHWFFETTLDANDGDVRTPFNLKVMVTANSPWIDFDPYVRIRRTTTC